MGGEAHASERAACEIGRIVEPDHIAAARCQAVKAIEAIGIGQRLLHWIDQIARFIQRYGHVGKDRLRCALQTVAVHIVPHFVAQAGVAGGVDHRQPNFDRLGVEQTLDGTRPVIIRAAKRKRVPRNGAVVDGVAAACGIIAAGRVAV